MSVAPPPSDTAPREAVQSDSLATQAPISYAASHSATAIPSQALIRSPVLPEPSGTNSTAFLFPDSGGPEPLLAGKITSTVVMLANNP